MRTLAFIQFPFAMLLLLKRQPDNVRNNNNNIKHYALFLSHVPRFLSFSLSHTESFIAITQDFRSPIVESEQEEIFSQFRKIAACRCVHVELLLKSE